MSEVEAAGMAEPYPPQVATVATWNVWGLADFACISPERRLYAEA